jgi:hypothetical protein
MPTRLHASLLTVFLLFAAGACLLLSQARLMTGDLETLVLQGQRGEALDHRLAASNHVIGAKDKIIDELIDDRIRLGEAAARFQELNGLVSGDGNEDLIGVLPVVTGEEAVWRTVLLWAKWELWRQTDRDAPAVLARLRAEYRKRFGQDPGPRPPITP